MNFADEIKHSFKTGSALTKLIYINLAVFLIIKIIFVFVFLANLNNPFSEIITNTFEKKKNTTNVIIALI